METKLIASLGGLTVVFCCCISCVVIVLSVCCCILYVIQNSTSDPVPEPGNSIPPFTTVSETSGVSANGTSVLLDNLDLVCDKGSVLNSFHLVRPSESTIQYKYNCLSARDIGAPITKTTPLNDEGAGALIYLDRHDVKCDDGFGLSGMHLKRSGNNTFQYEYSCAPVPKLGNCVAKTTPSNDVGGVIYLDRHDVKCDANQVLSRAHVVNDGNNKIHYEYTCCSR